MALSQSVDIKIENINKHKTYWDALEESKKDKKRLFVLFTASWCSPCQKFKKEVLFRKDIWKFLNDNCVIYFLDIDKERGVAQLFRKYKIWHGSVPTSFVFSNDGKYILGILTGYKSINNFAKWYNSSIKLEQK